MVAVESDWQGFREVNRVEFDPEKTSISRLQQRLQEVGTYIRTVPEEETENR